MSAGPPRWTWRSMSSTACWSSDARTTSASPNLDGAGVLAPTPLIRATQSHEPSALRHIELAEFLVSEGQRDEANRLLRLAQRLSPRHPVLIRWIDKG